MLDRNVQNKPIVNTSLITGKPASPARKFWHCVITSAFFLIFLHTPFSTGFAASGNALDTAPEIPWHISAREMTYDSEQDRYIATGDVSISKLDRKITADWVLFDQSEMKAHAKGHVVMNVGGDVLTGEALEADLENQTGLLTGGSVFLQQNNFHIRGDQIKKTGEDTYEIESARITTCDDAAPAWEIRGKNVRVTVDGYGTLENATFRVKGIPLLYSPYVLFPAKVHRQSGFLPPEISHSDRKGFDINLPYFWAINESSDATLYAHYMTKRGLQAGAEYRYLIDPESKGTVMFDYLDDRETDDGIGSDSRDWGYEDDTVLRPNSDRYWFRMKHDQQLPKNFPVKLDLDIVSDQDYLDEFKDGHNGFEKTKTYFQETFGREMDDYDDPERLNQLNINRNWNRYALNMDVRWYDNVILRRQGGVDKTVQDLPEIRFNAIRQQIGSTPLQYRLDSEYAYLYSEDNSNGHRVDIHPTLIWPLRLGNYATLETSIGYRETAWFVENFENVPAEQAKDKNQSRGMFDFKMDLGSELTRIYEIDGNNFQKVRHWVRPRIVYNYTPDKSQREYPSFNNLDDGINYIDRKNEITLSVANLFTGKRAPGKKGGLGDVTNIDNTTSMSPYAQFCWFEIRQTYDFYEAQEGNPSRWLDQQHQRPIRPLYAELDLWLMENLTLETDAEWSHYAGDFASRNIALRFFNQRGDRFYIAHRYDEDQTESFYLDFMLKLFHGFTLHGNDERNLRNDKRIQTQFGLLYEEQCWSVDFVFTDEPDDTKLEFIINFFGLGEVSS